MLATSFKESRIASIEMLFHFFKAVPSDYYIEKEKMLNDTTTQVFKSPTQTFKQKLNTKVCGFDYIEITGMYLCAFDQKILRTIMQLLQKKQEQIFTATKSNTLNDEYISTATQVYSQQASINIKDFYTLLNNKSNNRSSKDITSKLISSLQRLSTTILSFYTNNKSKILTAPLLVFYKQDNDFTFQLHPCVMTYHYESKNSKTILKYKQPFYLIDNSNYFTNRSNLEQLIFTKIQYKFASMNSKYKSFTLDLRTLRDELFLPTDSIKTKYNQTSKLKRALINLNQTSEYTIELINHSKHTSITVSKN